jgi:hypothetical protein
MTPATSAFFLRPDLNDFLYATIGEERNEMQLSVLSALTRLNVDPWAEAIELCELPKEAAAQRLASLIARLPAVHWALADSRAVARGLIELLPGPGSHGMPPVERSRGIREMISAQSALMLLCVALAIAAVVVAGSRERSRGDQTEIPAFSSVSPPQSR